MSCRAEPHRARETPGMPPGGGPGTRYANRVVGRAAHCGAACGEPPDAERCQASRSVSNASNTSGGWRGRAGVARWCGWPTSSRDASTTGPRTPENSASAAMRNDLAVRLGRSPLERLEWSRRAGEDSPRVRSLTARIDHLGSACKRRGAAAFEASLRARNLDPAQASMFMRVVKVYVPPRTTTLKPRRAGLMATSVRRSSTTPR